jgi:hypothetical protein
VLLLLTPWFTDVIEHNEVRQHSKFMSHFSQSAPARATMVELVAGLQRAMQMPVLRKPQAKGAFSFSGPAF